MIKWEKAFFKVSLKDMLFASMSNWPKESFCRNWRHGFELKVLSAISTILKYWENQIVSWTLICFNQRWCIFCNKISCHFGRNLKFAFIPFSQICIKDSVRWNLLVSPDLMMADWTQDCIALLQNLHFSCFYYIHLAKVLFSFWSFKSFGSSGVEEVEFEMQKIKNISF